MQTKLIFRIIGLLLALYSYTLLPPALIAVWLEDGQEKAFLYPFAVMWLVGAGLWLLAGMGMQARELHLRNGFIIVATFWVMLSSISAIPFYWTGELDFFQALFEAVSGFTTTGATVLRDIEQMPASILYYRQQLQFIGGLGVVVFAIAILPMLGIGGLQLYRAEAPGPMRDDKFTPRLAHSAKALLYIYFALIGLCTGGFVWAGMGWYEALLHSFATISTGGFSPYNDSIGHFQHLPWVEIVAMIFMFLGGLNFTVHYLAFASFNPVHYWHDLQTRVFLAIIVGLTLVCTVTLLITGFYQQPLDALRYVAFHVISLITSTGFTTTSVSAAGESVGGYKNWPLFVPVLVLGSGFIGGCVGSTAGGFRVLRIILLFKQGMREVHRLIHPNAVIPVKIGHKQVSTQVAEAVWGFAILYLTTFLLIALGLMASGLNEVDAFSAAASCLNLSGPALGNVADSFAQVNDAGLCIGSFAMLLGRLEIFTFLVLLMPSFWMN